MPIDYNILIAYGGVACKVEKGAIIFHEGNLPYFFYQLEEGSVRMYSTNMEGKELTQGYFEKGQSFGEPPLLLDKAYPSTAEAATPAVLVKIRKEKFYGILRDYPEIARALLFTFAERIYSKATAAQIWVRQTPEEKIAHFLDRKKGNEHLSKSWRVPYTRQQIADFTGLRVETVIRTLIRMSSAGKVKILGHKLYY
ncbi:Crp/Fnr family transcriptional regulator [Niabella drilacis]|uniref:CRP/FNR family transcriptional regulator, anaerobic regulatory protein n=1 Tax=Niabella drilacis (strain DSM 25811 / CCM 8410 / CCUG 62505 / LMG 26954 / E90) TaxID=1285928 RepID=A0A1G6IHT6_NIADE|nr:Crp/Fnr family transcriptional regulator [Niabella drilacis]SDC06089.1 CRP/FNR family transcriptional regulator, anaerobic regulatory protein [Niabella drilacis]